MPVMKGYWFRWDFLCLRSVGLLGLLLFSGCLIDQIGGAFKQKPEDLEQKAADATKNLSTRLLMTSTRPETKQKLAPSMFMEKPGWGTDEALE